MEHFWYTNNFQSRLKELRSLVSHGCDDELAALTIELLKDAMAEEFIEEKNPTIFLNLSKEAQEILTDTYERLNPIIFLKSEVKKFANQPQMDIPYVGLRSIYLNDQDLLGMCHDFYKYGTSKEIYTEFLRLTKEGKCYYHIFKNSNLYLSADCIYLPFFKEFFIRVNKYDTLADIIALNHEYGHGINQMLNPNYAFYSGILNEIISTFMELLSYEYYSNIPEFATDANILASDYLMQTIGYATSIVNEFNIVKQIKATKKNTLNTKIKRFINEHYDQVIPLFDETAENYYYVFGMMVAIELFMLYLTDPDKVTFLLFELIKINPNNNLADYLKKLEELGININEHNTDYQNHLKRKLNL